MSEIQVVDNAEAVIRALHTYGWQVGPMSAFGPRDEPATARPVARDAFAGFEAMLASLEERSPWNSPELR